MANIEFFTGFEGCGSSEDARSFFDAIYSYSSTVSNLYYSATGGFSNGKCVRLYGAHSLSTTVYNVYASINCGSALTKTVGFHISNINYSDYRNTTPGNGAVVCFLGPDIQVFYSGGDLQIYRLSTLLATHTVAISSGVHHIEVKVEVDDTAGYVGIKLDGTLVYESDALNTGTANITGVRISRPYDTVSRYYDNIFIADDWVGKLKSALLQPNSDDSVQFTPSAGSDNYAMVDDIAQDGDTTYVESVTNGHKDRYGFSNLDVGLDPKVLTVVGVAKKTDVGAVSLKLQSQQNTTNYDLDTFTLSADYPAAVQQGQFVTLDTCPDNTTALSRNEVNTLKFGFEAVI